MDGANIVVVPGLSDLDRDLPDLARTEEVRRVKARHEGSSVPNDLESMEVLSGVLNRDGHVLPCHLTDFGAAPGELVESPLVLLERDAITRKDASPANLERRREHEGDPDGANHDEAHNADRNNRGHVRSQVPFLQSLTPQGRKPWRGIATENNNAMK